MKKGTLVARFRHADKKLTLYRGNSATETISSRASSYEPKQKKRPEKELVENYISKRNGRFEINLKFSNYRKSKIYLLSILKVFKTETKTLCTLINS